jgi:hypothetical protein
VQAICSKGEAVAQVMEDGFLLFLLFSQRLVALDGFARRINNEESLITVEKSETSRSVEVYLREMEAYDTRDLKRAGHDGCVRRVSAEHRREAKYPPVVHPRRAERCEVVREQDVIFWFCRVTLGICPTEIPDHSTRYVFEIGGTFPEKRVFRFAKALYERADYVVEDTFDIPRSFSEAALDAFE